jgi:hypothetical protein
MPSGSVVSKCCWANFQYDGSQELLVFLATNGNGKKDYTRDNIAHICDRCQMSKLATPEADYISIAVRLPTALAAPRPTPPPS